MYSILAAALAVGLAAAPGDAVDDYVKQSRAALTSGDADKALELAEKAVAADPNSASALFVRGLAKAALHKSADAIADYDQALKIDPKKAEICDSRGSEEFKLGKFAESVADFDRYLETAPKQAPGHWRRGISLYYLGRYDDGRKQFAAYQEIDANDVENAVWHFLCAARADGVEKARASMLKVGKDTRIPMMPVYDLYRGKAKPEDVMSAALEADGTEAERKERLFMAHLYLGLYFDATGDKKQALEHISLAAHKYYVDGYMGDVARVHETVLMKESK
ncbi:MAG TPA: tetratricopeptide repeat protein [Gemmataceae bacterium]|nr:tetratricopeptide repeat protein [Gemmataceae bacterium]